MTQEEILEIIDREYALWDAHYQKAKSEMADILAKRIWYQLATIRRIRKKILGIPVDMPGAEG